MEEEHEEEEGEGDDHEEEEEGHHEEEEGDPFIDLKQTRIDLEGAIADPLPGFPNFNFRMGVNDYEHQEVEPSGEVGAAFDNQAWEARAELSHDFYAGWEGAFGIQLSDRSFSVVGGRLRRRSIPARWARSGWDSAPSRASAWKQAFAWTMSSTTLRKAAAGISPD